MQLHFILVLGEGNSFFFLLQSIRAAYKYLKASVITTRPNLNLIQLLI